MGIEPTLAAWEAAVLPLNYTRVGLRYYGTVGVSGNRGGALGLPIGVALRKMSDCRIGTLPCI